MSLRWKVAFALAAVVSVAVVVVGAVTYRTTASSLRSELDRSIAAIDPRLAERILAGDERLPDRSPLAGFDAQVVAVDGTVLSSTFDEPLPVDDVRRVASEARRGRISTVAVAGERYRVLTVGFERGIVQIGRSMDETDRVLQTLRLRILLWTLVTVTVAVAAGLWLAGRVTAPLRRLTGAAERVGTTGDLDVAVGDLGADEVGRLGAAFDGMIGALRRSRAEQHRLVQDAGHELRTPLTSLRSNLDTLERFPEMPDHDRRSILADLRSETLELADLVDEIVQLATGEHADEPIEPVDVTAMSAEVADRFARRAGRSIEVHGVDVVVAARRASLHRALVCLVDNACKFDDSGAPIDISVDRSGGVATVTVADRGPGIDEGDLDRVFDRFHRSDAARAMPGSGLGLSIVREIARRHGGDAFASSRSGGGAVVGFSVAVLPPPEPVVGSSA